MTQGDELLTTSEAAQMLGRTVWSVHHLIRSGQLTPVRKLPGTRGALLFNRTDVLALCATETEEVAS